MLATLNSSHPYFERGYAPEPKEKKAEPIQEIQVADPDGFFAHLRPPKRDARKKTRNLFVTKEQKEEEKLRKLEKRGLAAMAKIEDFKAARAAREKEEAS